jgi:hypothetical protein
MSVMSRLVLSHLSASTNGQASIYGYTYTIVGGGPQSSHQIQVYFLLIESVKPAKS